MDPATMNMLIYAGLAVGGYAVHWLQARQTGTPASSPVQPLTPDASPLAPASPNHLTIGHGALINLLLGAFSAGISATPATPSLPSIPVAPTPALPGQPAAAPVDVAALVQMFLTHLQAVQPAPTLPVPAVAKP